MKAKIHQLIFIILLISGAYANGQNYCLSNRFSEFALFDSSEIHVDSNITFANPIHAFSHNQVNLQMDIYYPEFASDSLQQRPFILLIHGGAFLGGSRKDMSYECMEYARRGFVCATIDYRLGWNCPATDIINICVFCQTLNQDLITATYCAAQDAKAAMRYIKANALTYKIDPDFLFTGGESAGGITALHSTFWDQSEANLFDPNAITRAGLLDTAGNNFPNTYQIKAVINSCGAVSKDSIILNNGNIPVINFHDEFDCVVPPQYGQVISCVCQPFYWAAGSNVIYSKLNAIGTCSQYYQVPLSAAHCSFPKYQLIPKASCFLKSIFCQSCQSSFSNQPNQAVTCASMNDIAEFDNPQLFRICEIRNDEAGHFILERKQETEEIIFKILDREGKSVLIEKLPKGKSSIEFSLTSFSAGIYFISAFSNEHINNFKILNP